MVDYETPDTLAPAEYRNYIDGSLSDAAQAMLLMAGQVPAFNWSAPIATGTPGVRRCVFDERLCYWYGVNDGGTDKLLTSADGGQTWTATPTGAASGALFWPAIDPVMGHQVITETSHNLVYFDTSWHEISPMTGTVVQPKVFWDPVNSVWAIGYYDSSGGTAFQVYTSTNMTSWTHDVGTPSYLSTPLGNHAAVPSVGVGNGQLLVGYARAGGSPQGFIFGARALSGTSWTTMSTATAHSLTTVSALSDPLYDDNAGLWVVALKGTISGTAASEFWTSPDGVTWSWVSTLTSTIAVQQMAILGDLWVALTVGPVALVNNLLVSVDEGATWRMAFNGIASPGAVSAEFIWSGGGGFLYCDTGGTADSARYSQRFGLTGVALS